jgi:hypothetical protein
MGTLEIANATDNALQLSKQGRAGAPLPVALKVVIKTASTHD